MRRYRHEPTLPRWAHDEPCSACGHPERDHLELADGYLTGRYQPCKRPECPCQRWQPRWAHDAPRR